MKRLLIAIFSLLLAVSLFGCDKKTQASTTTTKATQSSSSATTVTTKSETKQTVQSTTETAWDYVAEDYPLHDFNPEYELKTTTLKGYYFNPTMHKSNDQLLFVDVDEFLAALDGFLVYEEYKFERTNEQWKATITFEDEDTHETEDVSMIIDLANDSITLDLFFLYNTNDMEETDYSFGLNTIQEKSYSNDDITATYTFAKYKIDFFKYEDKYFVPYWVANLFFCTFDYCNVFFNGASFIFVYTDLSDLTDEQKVVAYDESPMKGMSATKEARTNQYYQLAFIFEQIFGVRDSEGFTNFNDALSQSTRLSLVNQSPSANETGYLNMCYKDLDDLHTYCVHPSFYLGKNEDFSLSYEVIGDYFLNNYNLYWDLADERDKLELVGTDKYVRFYQDTAIITFDSFSTAATKDVKDEDGNVLDDAKDKDSYYYIKYCLELIAEHGGIKNIVMDTTLNGGGNVGAMLRVLGFFIRDIYSETYYKGFGYKTSTCYNVDTDLDGDVDDDDLYDEYTWYCLSSSYSYSAANNFAIICKNSGVKVIGTQTGGGMCSILPLCLIDGTSIYTSGYSCMTYYTDKEDGTYTFHDVQYGIAPDILLSKSDFYNDEAIYNVIHAEDQSQGQE